MLGLRIRNTWKRRDPDSELDRPETDTVRGGTLRSLLGPEGTFVFGRLDVEADLPVRRRGSLVDGKNGGSTHDSLKLDD